MSYAAVLGGVVTVIGTSTNLVVSDLLVAQGEQPLGVFEITGVGLPVAVVGVVVLVLTAPRLLRHGRPSVESDPAAAVQPYTIALAVEPGGPLVGRTIEAAGLRHLQGVFLAGIERAGTVVPARPGTVLGWGDVCYFAGDVVDVVDLLEVNGLVSAEHTHLVGAADRPDAGLFEAVVSERSDLAGATLRDAGFRARYDAAVLAIRRHDDDLPGKLGTVVLRPGDVLLVLATPEFERVWRGHGDFSVIASLDAPPPVRRDRSSFVIVAILAMVASVVTGLLDLMEASLLAAVVLIALRVISVTEARRAVNLNVVLTIAMSISLGTAVAVSGLAAEMATLLGNLGDPFGDTGRLVAVLATTMVLTELLSNNAAAGADAAGGDRHGDRGRSRPTLDGDRRVDRSVLFVPVADRVSDEPDGVRPRRVPVPRLHPGRRPAQSRHVDRHAGRGSARSRSLSPRPVDRWSRRHPDGPGGSDDRGSRMVG